MIVKEYVDQNFERNQEPLKSMGLGLKPQIVALRNELSEMYDTAMQRIDDPHYAGQCEAFETAITLIDKLPIMK